MHVYGGTSSRMSKRPFVCDYCKYESTLEVIVNDHHPVCSKILLTALMSVLKRWNEESYKIILISGPPASRV